MSIKEVVAGGIITLVIGGTAYTVNQADVVNNFANDTGMSQQQAEEYVGNVKEEDLVPYDEIGNDYITSGKELLSEANGIDCVNYEYEWQTSTLSCEDGKAHLIKTGNDEVSLGESYVTLASAAASEADISTTIQRIDQLNTDYAGEIINKLYETASINEIKQTNSYNKATLQAALGSN